MVENNEDVSEFNRSVQRHFNCLSDDNRNVRRKALMAIENELVKHHLTSENFEIVFIEILLNQLLKSSVDSVEKNREISLKLIEDSLFKLSQPEKILGVTISALVKRLGQQEILEPSEEIRLQSVNLLYNLIDVCSKNISPFVGEIIKILQQTLLDSYPEVKKSSCSCASLLAKSCPQYFHMESELLIQPLLLSITHQHSKVRVKVINTIGTVIQYGNNKSVSDVTSHLAQRMFDGSVAVRLAVVGVVGSWLLDLPDRYSYFHKLLPLLLSGVTDDVPEIRCEADALWNDVGEKFLMENEEKLKDKIDFDKPLDTNYPSHKARPNLGCRQLVYDNYSKILPALSNDIGDWIEETRMKAAQLLVELLLNEESNIVQHLDKTLDCLYKAAPDASIVQKVMQSARLVGYFVDARVWVSMVVRKVQTIQSSFSVLVLASIVKGSCLQQLRPHLSTILHSLIHPNILHLSDTSMHESLLEVVAGMVDLGKGWVQAVEESRSEEEKKKKKKMEEAEGGDGGDGGAGGGDDGRKGDGGNEGVGSEEIVKSGGEDWAAAGHGVGGKVLVGETDGGDALDHLVFLILFFVKALSKEHDIHAKATELIEKIENLMAEQQNGKIDETEVHYDDVTKDHECNIKDRLVEEGGKGLEENVEDDLKGCSKGNLEGKWVEKCVARVVESEMMASCDQWTSQSPHLKLLESILSYRPSSIKPVFPSFVQICQSNLHPDKHHELKHRFFSLLANTLSTLKQQELEQHQHPQQQWPDERMLKRVVMMMIMPNLVWKVGRMAEVVRKSAVACLYTILSFMPLSAPMLLELMEAGVEAGGGGGAGGGCGGGSGGGEAPSEGFLCIVKGLLEDDNRGTRLTTLHIFSLLFRHMASCGDLTMTPLLERQVYNFYPELLKRLDDNNDDVRVAASEATSAYLLFLTPLYDTSLYSAHLVDIFKGLLVHMDDPDSWMQEAVCDTLKKCSHLSPEVLLQLVEAVKFKHRSTTFCDSLTQHIHSLKL